MKNIPAIMRCDECESPVEIQGKKGPFVVLHCTGCGLDTTLEATQAVSEAQERQERARTARPPRFRGVQIVHRRAKAS